METYDAILVGSGHNALVTAAYLTRAGWSVLVLEKNDRPGGLVRTEEVTLPGFHHDVYSSAHPLFVLSRAYAELGPDLAARGLYYVNTDLPTGVCMPGERTTVLSTDIQANIAEADRLQPGDGAAWLQMMQDFEQVAPLVLGLITMDLASPQARLMIRQLMLTPDGKNLSPFAAQFL